MFNFKKVEIAKYEKIVVWGDSVAKGVIYDEQAGRYSITKNSAVNQVGSYLGVEILNRSKMGITIEKGSQIIMKDLEDGLTADIALVEYGGNDCDFIWSEVSESPDTDHKPRTPLDIFEKNLRGIVEKLSLNKIKTALTTLPPLVADKYFKFITRNGLSKENILKWLGDINHIYRYHEMYSLIIQRIAREYGCILYDLRSAFLSKWNNGDYVCEDGVHPNDLGQALIGETILSEALGLKPAPQGI